MSKLIFIKKFIGLSASSVLSIVFAASLTLLLAKFLNEYEFGITRVVTAYMIGLTMLGHFTVHDALASFVAKTDSKNELKLYYSAATWLVFLISIVVSFFFLIFIEFSKGWDNELIKALYAVVFILPFACLTIVFNASLQAIGSYTLFGVTTILNGLIPLTIIATTAWCCSLDGWIVGRIISILILFVVAWYVVRDNFFCKFWNNDIYHKIFELWCFARIQIISGVLSLITLSGDVIILERITKDLKIVGSYGLASLFIKSGAIFTATLGRIYFRPIALVRPYSETTIILKNFIIYNFIIGVFVCSVIYFVAPVLISYFYKDSYQESILIIFNMCYGGVFYYLANSLSVVNIALGFTKLSVKISLVNALIGFCILILFISKWQGVGAAWAMNITYFIGCALCIFIFYKNGYLSFCKIS